MMQVKCEVLEETGPLFILLKVSTERDGLDFMDEQLNVLHSTATVQGYIWESIFARQGATVLAGRQKYILPVDRRTIFNVRRHPRGGVRASHC